MMNNTNNEDRARLFMFLIIILAVLASQCTTHLMAMP